MRIVKLSDSYLRLIGPGLLLAGADQVLKSYVNKYVVLNQQIPFFKQSLLVLMHTINEGVAWQRFVDLPEFQRVLLTRVFPTLVLVVSILIFSVFFRVEGFRSRLAMALIFFGGASNVADHWRLGYVTDTLGLWIGRQNLHLPFNIADVGILLGTLVLMMGLLGELFIGERGSARAG